MRTRRSVWGFAPALVLLGTVFQSCSNDSDRTGGAATASSSNLATADATATIVDPGSPGAFRAAYVEVSAPLSAFRIGAWYPTDATAAGSPSTPSPIAAHPQPFPVVLLAPGDAGSGKNFTYLAEHLASWGYVVVSAVGTDTTEPKRVARFEELWKGLSASDNTTAQSLAWSLRTTRIALIAATSASAALFDEAGGIDTGAIVALGAHPAEIAGAASSRTPAMLMFSGKDARGGDPIAMRLVFQNADPRVRPYLVYFPDGVADSFVDTCLSNCSPVFTQQRAHELVTRYVTAFLQTYVRGDARYARDLGGSTTEQADGEDDPPDAIITRVGS